MNFIRKVKKLLRLKQDNDLRVNGLKARDENLNYNRNLAKLYAETYAENPNKSKYPYYEDADCANFISQVLAAGGIKMIGNNIDSYDYWFCYTNNPSDLENIAITWRAARYFRRHWGNENGMGRDRAYSYYSMTVRNAIDNFDKLYKELSIGDVIQHGDPKNNNYPYHTQVIHDKGFNYNIGRSDLYMAQHTENRKNVSLYTYLSLLNDKDERYIYLYKISKN